MAPVSAINMEGLDGWLGVDGEVGEGAAIVIREGSTMFILLLGGATVPRTQAVVGAAPVPGVARRGTYWLGLPPCWFLHVAESMCPGALFLHVTLVWVALALLPWVQQYPRAPVDFGVMALGAVDVGGFWCIIRNWRSSTSNATNS